MPWKSSTKTGYLAQCYHLDEVDLVPGAIKELLHRGGEGGTRRCTQDACRRYLLPYTLYTVHCFLHTVHCFLTHCPLLLQIARLRQLQKRFKQKVLRAIVKPCKFHVLIACSYRGFCQWIHTLDIIRCAVGGFLTMIS